MKIPNLLRYASAICFVAVLSLVPAISQASGIIDTIAGGGPNNLPALQVGLGVPSSVAVDSAGNLFMAIQSNGVIRKVDASTGILTTVAGTYGLGSFCGDGGAATSACLKGPTGVALDTVGNLFIADQGNHRIRKVDASTGVISTVVGIGDCNTLGDGGPATSACLRLPSEVVVDSAGNLFIADLSKQRIRKVDTSTGIISTVAGPGPPGPNFCGDGGLATDACLANPSGVVVDSIGNVFIADQFNERVRKVDAGTGGISTVAGNGTQSFCGDGGVATSACLNRPNSVVLDSAGNLFIADQGNHRIRKVDASTGFISTVAGDGTPSFCGDGGVATSACLNNPTGVTVDTVGNLFIADAVNKRIRKVDANTGTIATLVGNGAFLCGDGGLAVNSCLNLPRGVAVDSADNLFIAVQGHSNIRKVDASTGLISTVAGNGEQNFCGDGGLATSACLRFPYVVAMDSAGNMFIADESNHRIRKVDASTGFISTVAGDGTANFCGDGGPATNACLNRPNSVTVDSIGNLFIADRSNHRVRKVDANTGFISTVAGDGTANVCGDGGLATNACLRFPSGVVVDSAGNLFIADEANAAIRKVDASTGFISTVAGNGTANFCGDGGPATSACLNSPTAVALDSDGNLFVADMRNNRIRKVDASTGFISTVAGNGTFSFCGDGGPATNACLSFPTGVAVDSTGNLFIADLTNQRIRQVTPEDTIPPVVNAPDPITVAGVDALGIPATDPTIQVFLNSATATDDVDGPLIPLNDAPANFPLGITTVLFSATDVAGNSASATSTVTVVTNEICGNGILDAAEACDDGNLVEGDGCSSVCEIESPAICGNAIVEVGESCDDGNAVDGDGCTTICEAELRVQSISPPMAITGLGAASSDVCDDIAAFPLSPVTSAQCVALVDQWAGGQALYELTVTGEPGAGLELYLSESCTSGTSWLAEANSSFEQLLMDNGVIAFFANLAAEAASPAFESALSTLTTTTISGSGHLTGTTTVPTGVTLISADPTLPLSQGCLGPINLAAVCGDGVVDASEQCDDGNILDGDGCSNICDVEATCGNNIVEVGEECDDGGESGACDANCTAAVCSDSTLNLSSGEACDDGNLVEGDGCSNVCQIESPAICGNAIVEAGESCDDGNAVDGDGCTTICEAELRVQSISPPMAITGLGAASSDVCDDIAAFPFSPVTSSECAALVDQWAGGQALYELTVTGEPGAGLELYLSESCTSGTSWAEEANTSFKQVLVDNGFASLAGLAANLATPGFESALSTLTTTTISGSGHLTGTTTVPIGVTLISADPTIPPSQVCLSPINLAAICGDGVVGAGETCDDGNTLDGDACSATCTVMGTASHLFEYINVGDTNTPIPEGTGTFTDIRLPAISDGKVAYRGVGVNHEGIYLRDIFVPNSLVAIADLNTPIPGGSGNFTFFSDVSLDEGNVAFYAEGPSGQAGIYTFINGTLEVVADRTTLIPGGSGTFNGFGYPWICNGMVVFRGVGSQAGEEGIYTTAGGTLRVVADTTTPAPIGEGTFTSFGSGPFAPGAFGPGNRACTPTVDNGKIVFCGTTSSGQEGIYLDSTGTLSTVADLTTTIPGGNGTFTDLHGSSLAAQIEDDQIVFLGLGDNNQRGLYSSVNGVLTLILDQETTIPSGAPEPPFQQIQDPFLGGIQGFGLSHGFVSVLASVEPSGGSLRGNGVITNLGGAFSKVASGGDFVNGQVIGSTGTYGYGIDGSMIAFNVRTFGEHGSANFVAVSAFPEITILGDNPATVTVGDPYIDAGALAFDHTDGDLTSSLVVSGLPVDTNTPGSFVVTYRVMDSAGNLAQANRTVFVQTLNPQADLELTITDDLDPVPPGQPYNYTLNVTNHGPDVALGVEIAIQLPAGVTLNSAWPSAGTCSGTEPVTCSIGNLGVASTVVTVNVTADQAGVNNVVASVTGNAGMPDPNANNNTDIMETTNIGDHVFIVTATDDVNDTVCDAIHCSLREAIIQANVKAGTDLILFDIQGTGPHTIQPGSTYILTGPVVIDGYSQSGASPNTLPIGTNASFQIEIDGSFAVGSRVGLDIRGGNTTVRGLVINRFGSNGIRLDTNGGNVIEGNYIGTDRTGLIDLGNGSDGIQTVNGSAGNMIGGLTLGARNLIAGNAGDGIDLNTSENVIIGNYIGVNAIGTVALGNSTSGIQVGGSTNNVLGGTTVAERNVISANGQYGVRIVGSTSTNNVVQGNYIGTDATGDVDLGNTFEGVLVHDAPTNLIGGAVAGAGNVISGNDRHGILFQLGNATGNQVQGNFIGTNASGTGAIQNGINGVHIAVLATNNIIGGTTPGARNVISGNSAGSGVSIGVSVVPLANHNSVVGNFIGTDVTGTLALPNSNGLWITGPDNIVGGPTAAARNVISGNAAHGIVFSWGVAGPSAFNNMIQGNYIGTDVSGDVALGNGFYGIFFTNGAANNTVDGNVISANGKGITLGLGENNTVTGNLIGLNAAGSAALGNTQEGIRIASPNHTIGGTTPAARNVISGNGDFGIIIVGVDATDNVVRGNFIGTNMVGTEDLGNTLDGVRIIGAPGNTIGGVVAGEGNVISGNDRHGIQISSSGATGNVVLGNMIGSDVFGTLDLGNASDGVLIGQGASDNIVGGTVPGARNILSGNDRNGVEIQDAGSTGNVLQGNYIGTDVTGMVDLGNSQRGVTLTLAASLNVIGGHTLDDRNVISGNDLDGILISVGAGENVVEGNFIGTNKLGTGVLPNSLDGVRITSEGTKSNLIGGTDPGSRNVISGNTQYGVEVNTFAGSNVVWGNYIGIGISGKSALANEAGGILLHQGAGNNLIGGQTSAARNIVSGNGLDGVRILGSSGNNVRGNYIGTDSTGALLVGNARHGISLALGSDGVTPSSNNLIGGSVSGAGNLISGNADSGLAIANSGLGSGNVVQGNFIGTNAAGTLAVGNVNDGIRLLDARGVVIGGLTADARNVISGNGRDGVGLLAGTTGTVVQGNYIGTDALGSSELGNTKQGVFITQGSSNNLIGGGDSGATNVLSGNFSGVLLNGSTTTQNLVQGNLIGTDVTGTQDLGNNFSGVQLGAGAHDNTIGGDDSTLGARNIISGNDNQGILIQDSTTSGNLVMGNYIGTDISGAIALPNANGVEITDAAGNTIGGTTAGAGNVISGNSPNVAGGSSHGVQIQGAQAMNNVVQGNFIGTAAGGVAPLGNANVGVLIIDLAGDNTIGGTLPEASNVISANGANGVLISSKGANVIQGNFIGTDRTGTGNLGNGGNGVSLSTSVFDTTISGNTIGFNTVNGVRLSPTTGSRNIIQGNSIFSNGQLGIDLGGDGVTPNDAGDGDVGPNNLQNYPNLIGFIDSPTLGMRVRGTLRTTPNTQVTIELYTSQTCDSSGFGEGHTLLSATTLPKTGLIGSVGFLIPVPLPFPLSGFLTATARDAAGNTSEFSPCLGDTDGDGISDSVDPAKNTFSNTFNDMGVGGQTQGQITFQGDHLLTIAHIGDFNNGVYITSYLASGPNFTKVVACGGQHTLKFFSNAQFLVACGSISLAVEGGMVELEVDVTGQLATVQVNEGNELTYEPTTGSFKVPETNTEPVMVVLEVQGQPTTVTLDAGNEILIDAEEGTFTTSPNNPTSVVVMVGEEEITVEPGEISKLLTASRDSFIEKGKHKNQNEGANASLLIHDKDSTRTLVGFDFTGVSLAGLTKATLKLFIQGSINKWNKKNPVVNAHRLLEFWPEGNAAHDKTKPKIKGTGAGVTWECATDSDISNNKRDCDKGHRGDDDDGDDDGDDDDDDHHHHDKHHHHHHSEKWKGGAFADPTAPGVEHREGQTGMVEWDVTADVLAGADHGWILIREKDKKKGEVRYYSKEGAAAIDDLSKAPHLLLEYVTP